MILNHYSEITLSEFTIPNDVSEYAQNIFIEKRKAEQEQHGNVQTNADTFHVWLTLTRLQAVSYGEMVVRKDHFEKARYLEEKRFKKIEKVNSSK